MLRKNTRSSVSSSDRRRWKIGSAIIIGCFIAIVAFFAWFFYVGSPKEIVAVADQFKPDPSWRLVNETIRPPQKMCIDVECPSVWRQWRASKNITQTDVENRLKQANWQFPVEGDCRGQNEVDLSEALLCTAEGHVGNYNVYLTIRKSSDINITLIGLNVWREKS